MRPPPRRRPRPRVRPADLEAARGSEDVVLVNCRLAREDLPALASARTLCLDRVELPPAPFEGLEHVVIMEVDQLDWSDLDALVSLAPTLRALRVSRMRYLTDLRALGELDALRFLELDRLDLTDTAMPDLRRCTHLRRVDLSSLTGGRVLPSVLGAPRLEALMLLRVVEVDDSADVEAALAHPTLGMFTWYPLEGRLDIGAAFDRLGLPRVHPINLPNWFAAHPLSGRTPHQA